MNNRRGDLACIYYGPGDGKNPPGILVEHHVLRNSVESLKGTLKVGENWHYLISNEICTINFFIQLADLPVGKNLNSQKAVILDNSKNLLPPGVEGPIYIDGQWKRYGYLNRPELTALQFIRSPFDESRQKRLFLTGKIGKYLDTGDIVPVDRKVERPGKEDRPVEPANEKEQKILAMWGKILGEKNLDVTADFFQVGGSSIEALLLVTEINKTFKRKLSIADIYEHENIRKQASLVAKTTEPDKDKKSAKEKNIFRLKVGPRGSKNIFLIHDATGEVNKYRLFCKRLKSRDNYWGLELKSAISGDLAPQELDIEGLASEYLTSIKRVQTRGPYYFGGWSVGGLIAFEMARQLEQAGEDVEQLYMFDTAVPEKSAPSQAFNLSSELELINQYFQVPVTVSNGFNASNPEELWQKFLNFIETDDTYNQGYILDKLAVYSELINDFDKLPPVKIFKYLNCFRSTANAGSKYYPGAKIKAKLQYYQAELSERDAANWQDFFTNKIELHQTRGNHFSMFNEPQLNYLITVFQQHNHTG
jgi:thioesterase domain-containing protein/acyl carrier protein